MTPPDGSDTLRTMRRTAWTFPALILLAVACGGVSDDYDLCLRVEKARCERRAACKNDPEVASKLKDFDLNQCVDYYEEICRTRDLASDVDKTEAEAELNGCLKAIAKSPCNELYPFNKSATPETRHKDLFPVCPFLKEQSASSDTGSTTDAGTGSGESCDVFAQNCSDDAKACYPPASNIQATDGTCQTTGDKAMGDSCSESTECSKGYFCFKPDGADASTCIKMCDVEDGDPGCPGSYACTDSGQGSIGYCKKTT